MAKTGHTAEWNSIKGQILPEFERVIKQFTADNKAGLKPARDDPKYHVVGIKVTIHSHLYPFISIYIPFIFSVVY